MKEFDYVFLSTSSLPMDYPINSSSYEICKENSLYGKNKQNVYGGSSTTLNKVMVVSQ